jgi:hypothetical protein
MIARHRALVPAAVRTQRSHSAHLRRARLRTCNVYLRSRSRLPHPPIVRLSLQVPCRIALLHPHAPPTPCAPRHSQQRREILSCSPKPKAPCSSASAAGPLRASHRYCALVSKQNLFLDPQVFLHAITLAHSLLIPSTAPFQPHAPPYPLRHVPAPPLAPLAACPACRSSPPQLSAPCSYVPHPPHPHICACLRHARSLLPRRVTLQSGPRCDLALSVPARLHQRSVCFRCSAVCKRAAVSASTFVPTRRTFCPANTRSRRVSCFLHPLA